MAREFTRSEFHALVWSKPITHIAKDFARSDVAIHKICRKHDVPTPPLGWWAKKQAGKQVKQARLPKAGKDVSDRMAVAARKLGGEAGAVSTAREDARIRASNLPRDDQIKVDPIITRTIAALRRAGPVKGIVEVSGIGLIRCEIGPDLIERLKLVLTKTVAAAAVQDFVLTEDARGAHFPHHFLGRSLD